MLNAVNLCRDVVLKTAKDLVDNAKALVAGAASNQEQLMSAANTVSETITRMASCVKLGAASLGSHQPDAQVTLVVISLAGVTFSLCPYVRATQVNSAWLSVHG